MYNLKVIQPIISALVLGLVGGIIPGPVLTATFTEILQTNFFRSLRIIVWAMVTESVIALICLVSLASLHLSESVFRALSFVGAIILVWISISLWKITKIDSENRIHFSLGKISAMIFANGMVWTYWITVCVPQAILFEQQIRFGQYFFFVLVEIGWLVSTVLVAYIFSSFRKLLSHPRAIPIIFKIFSLSFVYFAFNMVYTSSVFFLRR